MGWNMAFFGLLEKNVRFMFTRPVFGGGTERLRKTNPMKQSSNDGLSARRPSYLFA